MNLFPNEGTPILWMLVTNGIGQFEVEQERNLGEVEGFKDGGISEYVNYWSNECNLLGPDPHKTGGKVLIMQRKEMGHFTPEILFFYYFSFWSIINPCQVYGLLYKDAQQDPNMEVFRRELLMKAAQALDKARMVRFDEATGYLHITG